MLCESHPLPFIGGDGTKDANRAKAKCVENGLLVLNELIQLVVLKVIDASDGWNQLVVVCVGNASIQDMAATALVTCAMGDELL
jgi:hypothetical protein